VHCSETHGHLTAFLPPVHLHFVKAHLTKCCVKWVIVVIHYQYSAYPYAKAPDVL